MLCWFFLGMLKLGAGSPVFFRISKRLIEEAIKDFQGFEAIGKKMDRLSCPDRSDPGSVPLSCRTIKIAISNN